MIYFDTKKIEAAYSFVKDKLFYPKTSLIYDHIILNRVHEWPTPEEIAAVYPDPCGYGTGMEDGMINGGTMLDACLIRYELEHDEESAEFAKKIVDGMLNCAFSAKTEGYLPRGVCPADGKSHYPDSSRDQYTMFAFGMHRYLRSSLCTEEERKKIAKACVGVARRAEKNIVKETGYDMLTDDGGPTLNVVMWGEKLGNHEFLRLPMLYLLAYEASGDEHWFEKYREIRQEAYDKSLPMTSYWAMYTLQQMQVSVLVCHDVDEDEGWRSRYLELMNQVADYAEKAVVNVRNKMQRYNNYNDSQKSFRELETKPAVNFINLGYKNAVTACRSDMFDYFALEDTAQLAIITKLVPGRKSNIDVEKLFIEGFEKIDFSKHERNLPLFFVAGYYRSII